MPRNLPKVHVFPASQGVALVDHTHKMVVQLELPQLTGDDPLSGPIWETTVELHTHWDTTGCKKGGGGLGKEKGNDEPRTKGPSQKGSESHEIVR